MVPFRQYKRATTESMPTLLFSEPEMQFYKRPKDEYQCPRCASRVKHWNGDDSRCGFRADGSFRNDNWNCATLIDLRYMEGTSSVWCDEYYIATISRFDVGFGILKWYKSRGRTEEFRNEYFEPGTLKLAQQLLGDIPADTEDQDSQWGEK